MNLKQLAGELGCSTQPMYLSFSGMEALRGELIPLAVAEFGRYMKAGSEDGIVCLYGMRYIAFAKEEPHLFRFLFMRPNAFAEIKQALLAMIERSIEKLMSTYHIGHEEADVSGVSLVTSFNTVLIFLFSALFGLWLGWGVIGVAIGMSMDMVFRGAIFLWRLKSQKWTRFQVI